MRYAAVSPCNNVTCHMCCFRQRALYRKNTCLVCRTDHASVVFAEPGATARYDAYATSSEMAEYGVRFTGAEVRRDTEALLATECPVCREQFARFGQLAEHTRSVHGKQYCDVCAAHKTAFVCELALYTAKQLQRHVNDGDREGFTGHPRCRFCRNKRFYSDDELAVHVRDRHERCYLCDQENHQNKEYYRNYDDLYDHFRLAHYVCLVPLCVEKRFVVFREDLDLTAHMLKEHGGILGLNGRLVIGAQFQLLLLTFPGRLRPSAALQQDSIDTKRRRFEERAKHYLQGDADRLAKFHRANHQFRSKRIAAADLLAEYAALFSDNPPHEVSLLVYDFAELFPQHLDQRAQLQAAYDSMAPAAASSLAAAGQSFPLLGGAQGTRSFVNLSWGGGVGGRKTTDELFPKLAKPAKVKPPANGPIRYTVIKKPVKEPKPQVNTFRENTSYKPSYLDVPETSSASSLPLLGSSSGSRPASRTLLRPQSPGIASSTVSLPAGKFPALEKKEKKVIPPVKPVVNTVGQWGLGLAAPPPKDEDQWGIPIVDKRAEKLKRKQLKRK